MKKTDFILIIILLLILIPIALLFLNNKKGERALVKSDGEVIDVLNLENDGLYEYKNSFGFNCVEVKSGKVRVYDADCPNHDCVNKGFIDKNNESVIYLPHRFEVIVQSSKDDYDVIIQN